MFAAGVLAVPFLTALVFWQAYVAAILWGWFMVPFGLPPLSMAWAIGLSCLLTALKPNPYVPGRKSDGVKENVLGILRPIFNPAFSLLVGWIAVQWMPLP